MQQVKPGEGAVGDGQPPDAWQILRRQQDRRRYLRVLTPRRTGRERPRSPNPAVGVARNGHHLLASPAAMTRTATNHPDAEHVNAYLRHSCDLTMSGGLTTALLYPTAVCALAEHYVIRRVAGSSAASLAAAATAAAELGRGAPDPGQRPTAARVVPGFAGLAETVSWLAGADRNGDAPRSAPTGAPPGGPPGTRPGTRTGQDLPEQWRLARMFQPAPAARPLYRLLVAITRWPAGQGVQAVTRVAAALIAAPGRGARAVSLLLVLGSALSWAGLSISLAQAAEATGTPIVIAAVSSAALFLAVTLAAAFAVLLGYLVAALRLLRWEAEPNLFGLVPGVETADGRGRLSLWLDRQSGIPPPAGMPALATWLTDLLDDLAGIGGDGDRRALTFGDLWLRSTAERTMQDAELLRRAATDPELRCIDLSLAATNVSQNRAYRFPLRPAELPGVRGRTPLLFCELCLETLLPQRVVVQLVKASPATETEHACPRHDRGVLRELPDPWDVPVALAVRIGVARPGLLSAVPLYSVEPAVDDPEADEPGATAARTHWFCDGDAGEVSIDAFDRLLPRWPTFGLTLDQHVIGRDGVRLPAQDAAPVQQSWRPVGGVTAFLAAATRTGRGRRDALHADLPGLRGRIAQVRAGRWPDVVPPFLPQEAVLRLAGLGFEAGWALRHRFLGPDADIQGQTQTDRYRWIRLRLALRQYRALSVELGARLPLFRDLAASYRIPQAVTPWFAVRPVPGSPDPAWTDAATVVTTLRAMSTGGVLDFDADDGAAPVAQQLRLDPVE